MIVSCLSLFLLLELLDDLGVAFEELFGLDSLVDLPKVFYWRDSLLADIGEVEEECLIIFELFPEDWSIEAPKSS